MLIACLSDIHDRIDNLEQVLAEVKKKNPDVLIYCGDLTRPETLVHLARGFGGEIHLVLGNLDSEEAIKRTIDTERLVKVYYHQSQGRLTFDKRRVAFTHKPKEAEDLLEEDFRVVFYGHTHEAGAEERHSTFLVNPGDIQGRFGQNPGYAVYDTVTDSVTLHEVV